MNPELITKLVEAIVTVVIVIISAYVIPWLKNKLGEDKYATIIEFAEIVVRSAEKIYTPEQWQEKKQYAVNLVIEKAKNLGIDLSVEEVNAIIEGAVQAVKG
jgi:hypothetical protein